MNRRLVSVGMVLLFAACGPAEDVDVLPLPSLERSTPEARAGLPEVVGTWRFAGWELAPGDSAGLKGELPRFGALVFQGQRRDSIGGQYVLQAGRFPLYGEVRRDSVIALVGVFGPGDLKYITGRVERDTVWMETSSLTEPGSWPEGARAAFVRTAVTAPFARLQGATPILARADTTAAQPGAGAVSPGGLPLPAQVIPGASASGGASPAGPPPGGASPAGPPPAGAARPSETAPPPPAPRRPTPRPREPERPSPEPEEPPQLDIPLLGEDVPEDPPADQDAPEEPVPPP